MTGSVELLPQKEQEQTIERELRVRNDTTTWLAETLNGSMRTNFEFSLYGNELFGEDGQALREIFNDAIEEAQIIVKYNPGLGFELRRRLIERGELDDMEAMARGELYTDEGQRVNTIVVVSDFPPELMNASEDVGGYNTARKQTMLRIIALDADGKVRITSQSLDGSNRYALEAIYETMGTRALPGELLSQRTYLSLGSEQQYNAVDNLTHAHDTAMGQSRGGEWHAGIPKDEKRSVVDTYQFACDQHDLIDFFTKQKLSNPTKAERLRYKLAAAAKSRYKRYVNKLNSNFELLSGELQPESIVSYEAVASGQHLMRELDREGSQAAARGESFSGCGVTSEADEDSQSTEDQLGELGYGSKADYDQHGSLTFKCPNGHTNKRERNTLLDKCQHKGCSAKVSCKPRNS